MKKLFYKNYSILVYSILLNIFIFVLFQLINPIDYDISDDMYFATFCAEGHWFYGFSSYFFVALCGIVQKIIYPLNSYTLIIEFLCLISLISISYVIIKKFRYCLGTTLVLLFEAFFVVNYFSNVSFTKSPAIICLAGFLVLFDSVTQKKFWVLKSIYGMLLVIIGSTLRFAIFEVVVAFAAAYVVICSFKRFLDLERSKKRIIEYINLLISKRLILCFIMIFVVAFSLNYLSGMILSSNADVKYFREYTAARAAVWDYPIPEYKDCPDEYDKIGIDENDLKMLSFGYMDDEGAFSLENLRAIKKIANKHIKHERSAIDIITDTVKSMARNVIYFNEETIAYLAFAVFLFIYIASKKRRKLLLPIVLILLIAALNIYLHYIDRFPYRAVHVIWVSAVIILCYSIDEQRLTKLINVRKFNLQKRIAFGSITAVILAVVFCLSISFNTHYISYTTPENDDTAKLKAFIYDDSNKENKFELPLRMGGLKRTTNDVWFIYQEPLDKYLKFFITNYNSTYYKKKIKEFGVTNMYSALLENNIYYVDKDNETQVEMMNKYLNKYYSKDRNVNYKKIQDCGNYSVYKFIEK